MMKYKLLKDLPDVKAGTIFTKSSDKSVVYEYTNDEGYNDFYDVEKVESNPDWFAPYLFTTEDGIDIFLKDYFYTVYQDGKITKDKFNFFTEKNKSYKYFSTKELAEQYLESLSPNFKIGDIVTSNLYIGKVTHIGDRYIVLDYVKEFHPNNILKATNDEIIQYYNKQGWVKGAKFKCKGLDKIFVIDNIKPSVHSNYKVFVFSVDNEVSPDIKDCELIKEPNYPKSWKELQTKQDINGFSINVDYVVDYDTFYSQITGNKIVTENGRHCFVTEKQAQSTLAYAQLTQLHAKFIEIYNKENNCDWKPNWNNHFGKNWIVYRFQNHLSIICRDSDYYHLAFPTEELAKLFLEYHKDLLMTYFELDNA